MNLAHVPREFRELPLGLIDEPVLPSRSSMDEDKLHELTADIRLKGLIQPLIVVRVGARYEVIAGHRRWHACTRAGLAAVPCCIYPTKDAALEAVKYSENRFREDLNPAEEALWFAQLLEQIPGEDVDALCTQLGEKRSYIEGRLLLLAGDPDIFRALANGTISIGVAQQLNKVTEELMRRYYLDCAIRGGATVAVVSGWVSEWKRSSAFAGEQPAGPGLTATAGPVPQTNYFTCAVCRRSDNVHLMQPINVHTHCKMAILDPLLSTYRGDET